MLEFLLSKTENNSRIDSSHQSYQPGELSDPLTSFICSISDSVKVAFGNTDHLSLLNQLPPVLQAKIFN